jgi:hypothetical protein
MSLESLVSRVEINENILTYIDTKTYQDLRKKGNISFCETVTKECSIMSDSRDQYVISGRSFSLEPVFWVSFHEDDVPPFLLRYINIYIFIFIMYINKRDLKKINVCAESVHVAGQRAFARICMV